MGEAEAEAAGPEAALEAAAPLGAACLEAATEAAEAVFLAATEAAEAAVFLVGAAGDPLAEVYPEAEASIHSQVAACSVETLAADWGEASMTKATIHPLGEEIQVEEAPLVAAPAGDLEAVVVVP